MKVDRLRENEQRYKQQILNIKKTIDAYAARRDKKIEEIDQKLKENNKNTTYEELSKQNGFIRAFKEDKEFDDYFYWAVVYVRRQNEGIRDNKERLKDLLEKYESAKEKYQQEVAKMDFIEDNIPKDIENLFEIRYRRIYNWVDQMYDLYVELRQEHRKLLDKCYFDILTETVDRLVAEDKEAFIEKYCYGRQETFDKLMNKLKEGYTYEANSYNNYRNYIHFWYGRDNNDPRYDRRYIDLEQSFKDMFDNKFFDQCRRNYCRAEWLRESLKDEKMSQLFKIAKKISKYCNDDITDYKFEVTNDGNTVEGFIQCGNNTVDIKVECTYYPEVVCGDFNKFCELEVSIKPREE